MRYSIMLQIVTAITIILVSGAALFAWIQNRPPEKTEADGNSNFNSLSTIH